MSIIRRRNHSVRPTVPALDDPDEMRRQRSVDSLQIVDTPSEDRFDRIVAMAQKVYRTEAAVFSVVDHNREWHKARIGTPVEQVDRTNSFCSVTIQQDGAMIVEDAASDERFRSNPAVSGMPGVRFYAGVPIVSPSGEHIGALCVVDTKPRRRGAVDPSMLESLGRLIQAELRFRPE